MLRRRFNGLDVTAQNHGLAHFRCSDRIDAVPLRVCRARGIVVPPYYIREQSKKRSR